MKKKVSSLKNSAKSRRIKLEINSEEYKALIELGCNYCGTDLINIGGSSLDRLNSDKGYTNNNVVPCCKKCNVAKNDMSIPDFIEWINKVHAKVNSDLEKVQQMINDGFNYKEQLKLVSNQFAEDSYMITNRKIK